MYAIVRYLVRHYRRFFLSRAVFRLAQSLKTVLLLIFSVLLTSVAAVSVVTAADKSKKPTAAEIDWVDGSVLGPDDDIGHCEGVYLEPSNDNPEAGQEPSSSPLRSSANSTEIEDNNIVTMTGDVMVEEGYRRLSADKVTFYKDQKKLELEGNIVVREPGVLVLSEKATLDSETGTGAISPADYVLHQQHIRGGAEAMERKEDGTLVLYRASYTHCEPRNTTWELKGKEISIDQESGVGVARHARLNIKGIPVFYSPYLEFPIDDRRKTGVLWPSFSNTSSGGADIAVPYYLNLAPNYDATLTPRYIGNRGSMLEAESRWLAKHGKWVASGAYLPDEEDTGVDRWLVGLNEKGRIGENISTRVDFTRVSDEEFFNDLSTRGLEIKRQTHLDQLAELSYSKDDWLLSARVMQFQTIEPSILAANRPYKLLPQLNLSNVTQSIPFKPDYSFQAQYSYFDHDIRTRGHRLYLEPGASYPMEWLAGFIKPTVKLKHASYAIDNPTEAYSASDEEYTVPLFKLDSGLYFERQMGVNESHYTQTLEPRLFYLYAPEQNQDQIALFDTTPLTFGFSQLFREDRFTGRDRVGDSNQLTVGLTTRFLNQRGAEKLTASIGQIFYFKDRNVSASTAPTQDTDATSAVAAEVEYRPTDHLRVATSLLWNSHDDKINEGGLQFQYEPADDVLINFAYRYRRDNPFIVLDSVTLGETIEQTDVSAVFPFGKHWRAYLRWQYDLEQEHTIEDLVGLGYSDCCWDIRVVYQRGLNGAQNEEFGQTNSQLYEVKREHAVYVQFVLRGLGALGDKIDRILDKSILGYSDFAHNRR